MALNRKKLETFKEDEALLRKEVKKKLLKKTGFTKANTHLFLHERGLTKIPKPKSASKYLCAYFHNNEIEKIENLELHYSLTHLHLQWNKIKKIENLDSLTRLKKLYLGNNCISVVEGLEALRYLEELHIEKQKLEGADCLCFDPGTMTTIGSTLKILNVSDNKINDLSWVKPLRRLEVLIARNNKLEDFEEVGNNLCTLLCLFEVNFAGNPMCRKHRYKETLIARCSRLKIIDEDRLTEESIAFMQRFDQVRRLRQLNAQNKLPENKIGAQKFYELSMVTGPKTQSALCLKEPIPKGLVRAFDSSYTIVNRVTPKRSTAPVEPGFAMIRRPDGDKSLAGTAPEQSIEVPSLELGEVGKHDQEPLQTSQSVHEPRKGILKKPMPMRYI